MALPARLQWYSQSITSKICGFCRIIWFIGVVGQELFLSSKSTHLIQCHKNVPFLLCFSTHSFRGHLSFSCFICALRSASRVEGGKWFSRLKLPSYCCEKKASSRLHFADFILLAFHESPWFSYSWWTRKWSLHSMKDSNEGKLAQSKEERKVLLWWEKSMKQPLKRWKNASFLQPRVWRLRQQTEQDRL